MVGAVSKFTRQPQPKQGMTLADLEALTDAMRLRGVSRIKLGDLEVDFWAPLHQPMGVVAEVNNPTQAYAAEVAAVDPEPVKAPEVGPDGLTPEEADLAYASST